jgi:hypothetical protein
MTLLLFMGYFLKPSFERQRDTIEDSWDSIEEEAREDLIQL